MRMVEFDEKLTRKLRSIALEIAEVFWESVYFHEDETHAKFTALVGTERSRSSRWRQEGCLGARTTRCTQWRRRDSECRISLRS
jgi:hypothetical protein